MNRSHLWLAGLLAGSALSSPALAQDIDDTCAARAVGPPSAEQEAIIEGYRIDHPDIDIPVRSSVTMAAMDFFPRNQGMAASMQSFVQMSVFATIAGFVVPLLFGSGLKLAIGMVCVWGISLLLLWTFMALQAWQRTRNS